MISSERQSLPQLQGAGNAPRPAGFAARDVVYCLDMATAESITTAEELFHTPGLGRCELLRGELIMMSPAGSEHGMIALQVGRLLLEFVKSQGLGVVLGAETGFRIAGNPDTVRAPDVAFIQRDRVGGRLPKGFFPGAPDLAVEVLSPDDRAGEVLDKVQDWLNAGSVAVWIVDPKTQTVTVYGADRKAVMLTSCDVLTGGDLLPGFSTPVAELFTM
jgi:Uma2 family endonuclease